MLDHLRRRIAAVVAVGLVGLSVLLFGPGQVTPAEAFCGSLCSPQAPVLMAGAGGMAVPATAAAASGAGATVATAGAATGVGGISFGTAAVNTVGAAAAVGLYGWSAGWFDVAPGGITGVDHGQGMPGGMRNYNLHTVLGSGSSEREWTFGNQAVSGLDGQYGVRNFNPTPVVYTLTVHVKGQPGASGGVSIYAHLLCRNMTTGEPSSAPFLRQYVGVNFTEHGVTTNVNWPTFPARDCGAGNGVDSIVVSPVDVQLGTSTTPAAVLAAVAAGQATQVFPSANPDAPPATQTGDGVITQSVECVGPGGAVQSLSRDVVVNALSGGRYEVPELRCPEGFVPSEYGATWAPEVPSTGEPATVPLVPSTQTPGWVQEIPANYPECIGSTCTLELYEVKPDAPAEYCGAQAVACPDWYRTPLPQRESEFECRWGPYVVDTSRCAVYRVPGTTLPNAEVKPDGSTELVPWPPATVNAGPGGQPGTEPGGQGSPEAHECWPSGWSAFNPVQWVLMPTVCALRWAFVPTADTIAQEVELTRGALLARPPFSLLEPVGSVFGGLGSGWSAGCGSPLVDFDPEQQGRLAIPCAPPPSPAFSVLYSVAVAALVIGTAFAVWHMLVAALGGQNGESSS